MSSFRRFTPGSTLGSQTAKKVLTGTKSWLYGQYIISTGCSDLDKACGTGIPLDSLFLLSEDMGIKQASTLKKLFIAEGINSKQRVLILSSDSEEDVLTSISKLPPVRKTQQSAPAITPKQPTPQIAKPGAWQYGKFLSQQRNPTDVIPYNHAFDLSETEKDEAILSNISYLTIPEDFGEDPKSVLSMTLTAIASFSSLCKQEECVGRVIIDYSDILADNASLQNDLFSRIKILLRNSNLVVLSILYPDLNGDNALKYGDCVIALQPWQGITPPDEFSDTVGLLHVVRLPSHLSLYTHNKAIYVYGIKRSMHSLRLSELRIPPQGCRDYSSREELF